MMKELQRRLTGSEGIWVKELPHVLWPYLATPHSTTGETPCRLTNYIGVNIPIKVGNSDGGRCTPYKGEIQKPNQVKSRKKRTTLTDITHSISMEPQKNT